MIFTTFLFIILSSVLILGSSAIFTLTYIKNGQNTIALIILVFGIVGICTNLFAVYTIQQSKKLGRKSESFKNAAILELFFGAIITGILMFLIKDKNFEEYVVKDEPKNVKQTNLSKNDIYGIKLAINYDKQKLENIVNFDNKFKIQEYEFNNYKCNLMSYDLINNKLIPTFINVKTYENESINDIFGLTDKEIALLRFHKNFKIYYIYDIYGKKIIRPITHENYKNYLKDKDNNIKVSD